MNIRLTNEEAENLLVFVEEGFPNFFRCSVDGFEMMESICEIRKKLKAGIERNNKKEKEKTKEKAVPYEEENELNIYQVEPDPIDDEYLIQESDDDKDDFVAAGISRKYSSSL